MEDIRNINEVVVDNYRGYIQYTTRHRNFPSIIDGCKPSHRRCIHQMYSELPKHFVKSATAVGAIVKAHPHPSSIYATFVPLTQNDAPFPVFDGQGNFGSVIPKSDASAERYTEVKISDLSSRIFESFSGYVTMVEGDLNNTEPQNLATFLPLALLSGSYAIPVGLSTVDIPPLNAEDLCDYAIEVLKSGDISYIPDTFIRPNLGNVQIKSSRKEWNELIRAGAGRVIIMPRIAILSDKKLEIQALPETKSVEHVNSILQFELDRDQIDVRDETTTKLSIVVEICPYKHADIQDIAKRLLSKLTASKTYRFIYSDDEGNAVFCGVPVNMRHCLNYLVECATKWSNKSLYDLKYKLAVFEVIEQLKKDGVVSLLPKLTKEEAVKLLQEKYNIDTAQANSVLSKPLSYLTREHLDEIESLKQQIQKFEVIDNDIYQYLIEQYLIIKDMIHTKFKNRPATTFYMGRGSLKSIL